MLQQTNKMRTFFTLTWKIQHIFNIKVLYKQFLNKLIKMYLLKLYKTEQVHVHIVDIYQKEIEKKIEDCMGGRKLKIYFVPLS